VFGVPFTRIRVQLHVCLLSSLIGILLKSEERGIVRSDFSLHCGINSPCKLELWAPSTVKKDHLFNLLETLLSEHLVFMHLVFSVISEEDTVLF
jgi:hypothetical protein